MMEFMQMEAEYERSLYEHPYDDNTEEKLINICCNVIANGDFVRSDRTDYIKKWKIKIIAE